MNKVQIIYPYNKNNKVVSVLEEEAKLMSAKGFIVNPTILKDIDFLIYRGKKIINKSMCINHPKIIQGWEAIRKTSYMHEYYPIICDYSIPTFFLAELKEPEIQKIIKENNWDKVFIKSPSRSLFFISEMASVWPVTSLREIKENFNKRNLKGPYAIRKFIAETDIFYDEQRYWILNGHAYHPSGKVPDFVSQKGYEMYEFSGSHYFTIDVAGNYIVEINPGESSDRGCDNHLDFFCKIFEIEFLKNKHLLSRNIRPTYSKNLV